MESITFRSATIDDLPLLKEFEQGVISAERPFEPQLKIDPIEYYDLQSMIDADHVNLVVAEVKGTIVASGYLRIEQAKPYIQYSFYGYIGFMYVLPEYRGKGIIQQVMSYLENWGQEQGVTAFHLDVFAENSSAIRAYQKAGYLPNLVDMRKVIS